MLINSNINLVVRGLTFFSAVLLGWVASAESARALDLPSGLSAELTEVLVDNVGKETWIRFRFVSPDIGASAPTSFTFAKIEGDFAVICEQLALPYLMEHQLEADKIVVSIADRPLKFGTSDPDATQFFEQFRAENGDCIWEAF